MPGLRARSSNGLARETEPMLPLEMPLSPPPPTGLSDSEEDLGEQKGFVPEEAAAVKLQEAEAGGGREARTSGLWVTGLLCSTARCWARW